MKYRAEVTFNEKTARQMYNSITQQQKIINENGFVCYNKVKESDYIKMLLAFEDKAIVEGYRFKIWKKINRKWVLYSEVEN